MSSPTIKDVAKLAGVSISTVSRVINDSKPVSPDSRRKVEDAINKLDFKRNEIARSLVMKRSNLIGVLVKDLGIPYMAQIVRGVEEVGRMYKYDMLLSSSYGDSDQEKVIVDFMLRKQAEAIIMITENANPEVIVKLKDNKNSFILLDKYYRGSFSTVTIDFKAAAKTMTDYILDQGHKNIVYLADSSNADVCNMKISGYREAMEARGLKPSLIQSIGKDLKDGYAIGPTVKSLMKDGLSAVFAGTDLLALGLINYCLEEGLRVPEDLSVAGFGDSQISNQFTPSLTTIHEPLYDIGAVAMRRLVKKLTEEENIKEDICLPAQLMKRESVGPLK